LPIDVTKVIVHHISVKSRTHFHGACNSTVETSLSSFGGFTFRLANSFGKIEEECRLTFQDVSKQMEFRHQKYEEFASIIKLQQ
jgi:hypothetical protein